MQNVLVVYDPFSSFAHAQTLRFNSVRNKVGSMSFCRRLNELFHSLGVD